jgi:cellulose synthase operon protein C
MPFTLASRRFVALIAVSAIVAACSKDPEEARAEFFASAQEFAKKGEIQQAVLQYRNAIQADPRYGEARLELGKILQAQGDLGAARSELIRADSRRRPSAEERRCAVARV